MFRFNASKPGRRNDDISLVLVHTALNKCEKSFGKDPQQSQQYFQQAETLYNHWRMETGREDSEVSRKLDDLWIDFIARIDDINLKM